MIPKMNGSCEIKECKYKFAQEFTYTCIGLENWCIEAFLQRSGRTGILTDTEDEADIVVCKDVRLSGEEYEIHIIQEKIKITVSDEQGAVYAFITVNVLLNEQGEISCGNYHDKPRYRHRGLSLDCVRHFFTAEEVKKVIEEISLVKMNVLHWVLSNDQGFRMESKCFPRLHSQKDNPYYTQEQIRDMIAYAKVRGVTVIPEIDLPGHTTAILAAYPEYSCSQKEVEIAKEGGIYPVTLCPGHEKTYSFVEKLLDEICGIFPSKRIHTGGDEAPDWEWQKCPHCQAKMKELGLSQSRQLQGYFSGRVKKMLKDKNRDIICWNDQLSASDFEWEDEKQQTQIQYWSIQYADAMQDYIDRGGEFIYSDMFEVYLDYPCAMSDMKKVYNFSPMIREQDYSDHDGLSGLEGCLWTEYIETERQLEERLFPRVYALAENAWCNHKDYKDFEKRVVSWIEKARARGIHCLSAEEANPQGEAKKQGIMEYSAVMQSGMSEEMRALAVEFTKPGKEFNDRFMEQFYGIKH